MERILKWPEQNKNQETKKEVYDGKIKKQKRKFMMESVILLLLKKYMKK